MYFVANWKMYGNLSSLNTLDKVIKFSKSKTDKSKGAPIFGEHTIEVLIDYGFNKAEIDNLIKNKIIYSSSK